MIGLIIKLVLSLASFVSTFMLFANGYWGWGIVMILITAIIVLTIFRNEWIILAFNQLRLQNVEKAAKYLNRIKQPQYLVKGQRAYYYYLKALTGRDSMKMQESEKLFRKALNIGLKQDHDKAMAKLNIAAVCIGTGRRREAETLLSEAKKLDKKGMLTEHIKNLKKNMGRATSRNQMRMAQMSKGKRGKMK
ncbi:MAG TPA: tetratricopeptide repeat protein [Crocinitomix sp.]|nr:tetratricopeptide repeat protein [Crocinitomix sp.]